MERRLAAVVAADVVGFSRLAEADEERTLLRLKALRSEVIEPKVSEHHGRIVKFMGDGMLAEFASVVDAVRCAIEIQRGVGSRHGELPEGERIALRIGINLGDVVIDDGDVYGDGVNVAARLEGLAEPGGILLSGAAFDHVATKLNARFEALGRRRLKNLREPVRTYRVNLDNARPRGIAAVRPWLRRGRRVAAPAAAVLAVLAILVFWWPGMRSTETAPLGTAAVGQPLLPLPDKPSIAVLPFANISDDAEQDYFADGMTEDLITDLSKISSLFVIARNSTFVYKDKPVDVRGVARELGVKYVLEGSVRRAGNRVRINAQLIDGLTGAHLWAERYDAELSDVFALQDQVTERIVSALSVNLSPAERAREQQSETASQQAYDAFLRGWAYYRRGTPEDLAAAIPHLEKALALDSGYGRAHAALAAIYWQAAEEKEKTGHPGLWLGTMGLSYDDIRRLGDRHLEAALADPTPLAHQVAAGLRTRQGRHDEAIVEAGRAIELDPNDPVGHEALAKALLYAGRPSEAAAAIRAAMRLDPKHATSYLRWLGLAQFGQESYAQAAATLRQVLQHNPDEDVALVALTAALGHLGETGSTHAVLDELRRRRQDFFEQRTEGLEAGVDSLLVGPLSLGEVDLWPFKESADRERLRRGLELAGVPAESDSALSPRRIEGATTVDAEQARELFEQGATFIDVRTFEVWKLGHVPGARLLDLSSDFTEERLAALLARDQPVVIYCEGPKCLRSSQACGKAVSWGFRKVYYFRGGFPEWRAAGLPIERE